MPAADYEALCIYLGLIFIGCILVYCIALHFLHSLNQQDIDYAQRKTTEPGQAGKEED